MIFDVKQKELQHKVGLVVGVHVVDSEKYTTCSSTTKYLLVRLILLVAVKNGLVLVARYIVNALCIAPCAETIWSCCGV